MSTNSNHPRARLADHVRACVVGDQVIFLDLLRDKYVGVGGHHLHGLSEAILGGTPSGDAMPSTPGASRLEECIRRLRAQHLLSDDPAADNPMTLTLPEPDGNLDTDGERDIRTDWRALARLWRSTWVASAWLRKHSLAGVANRVADLRKRSSKGFDRRNTDALRSAVSAYMNLRPFALTSHDRCLNDSLTLIHFLASQGLFPRWVIGVRVCPFHAHSWVQEGGIVLNDLPDRVRAYRPILVV